MVAMDNEERELHIAELLAQKQISLDDDVLFAAEVGSTAHGINVAEQDDLDMAIVRIERFWELVNGPEKRQSMMIRTQPEGTRSGPGDIDLQVYTLRKFARLASSGNPSILAALYSPQTLPGFAWPSIYALQDLAMSKRAGRAFMGYMDQQMERWRGKRGQKNVNRPELVSKYGFDTKYAGHIVRLGLQGCEYLLFGKLTMPMPENQATLIRRIRTGGLSEAEALELADQVRTDLEEAYENTVLPDQPNIEAMKEWLTDMYRIWSGNVA